MRRVLSLICVFVVVVVVTRAETSGRRKVGDSHDYEGVTYVYCDV